VFYLSKIYLPTDQCTEGQIPVQILLYSPVHISLQWGFRFFVQCRELKNSSLLRKWYVVLNPDHRTCLGRIFKALPFVYKTVFIIVTLYLQRI